MAPIRPAVTARLNLTTCRKEDGKTYPAQLFYNAPYKLTNYFRLPAGGIEYMIMNASAGIMEHDCYSISLNIAAKTKLLLTAQSFEKIHRMGQGEACRTMDVKIDSGAEFNYFPLPSIPYENSAFQTTTKIMLADTTARLLYLDIIGCGRHLRGERFNYRYFKSRTEIWRYQQPLYIDNSHFDPASSDLAGVGMFEGYNYVANLIIYGYALIPQLEQQIRQLLGDNSLVGALTEIPGNGYLLRLLANSGHRINELARQVSQLLQ